MFLTSYHHFSLYFWFHPLYWSYFLSDFDLGITLLRRFFALLSYSDWAILFFILFFSYFVVCIFLALIAGALSLNEWIVLAIALISSICTQTGPGSPRKYSFVEIFLGDLSLQLDEKSHVILFLSLFYLLQSCKLINNTYLFDTQKYVTTSLTKKNVLSMLLVESRKKETPRAVILLHW